MEITLTSDEEAAVRNALSLSEDLERARLEILAAVALAEVSAADGKGKIITAESMRELASDVKQRGRALLAAAALQR